MKCIDCQTVPPEITPETETKMAAKSVSEVRSPATTIRPERRENAPFPGTLLV
jgi:hypothetical protein